MATILPVFPGQPQHSYTLTVGTERFRLRFTWRERTAAWYLDVYTQTGTPLAMGRRLSPLYAPLLDLSLVGGPSGHLLVTGPEPYTREQLGTDLLVLHVPADEVASPPASTLRVEV